MNRYEELKMASLQDGWVLLIGYMIKQLMDEGGFEGEVAAREAIRRFGVDRGLTNRKRLEENNVKVNLATLFCEGRDRPGEPRFIEVHTYEEEEDFAIFTHICSMADVWKEHGLKPYGRIYCEEFHIANYEAFSYGYAKINLARSLTQDGDDRCVFNHTFRPENMPPELRKKCFAKCDPGYVPPKETWPKPQGKKGFDMLWIKTYYYLLECAVEQFGELGKVMVGNGLRTIAAKRGKALVALAESTDRTIDQQFLEDHVSIFLDFESNPLWEQYGKYDSLNLVKQHFYLPLLKEVGLA